METQINEEKKPQGTVYKPGYYGKKRMSVASWADAYIKKWNEDNKNEKQDSVPYSICFSRQIGVGALKIADLLSEIIHCRVVDREILDHMAKDANLAKKVLESYDERYPGKMSELFSMLISEKTFIQSDYVGQLIRTVTALANTERTIFVGRGTHLILPRDNILSVRLICSKQYRISRLASMMGISTSEAETRLNIIDIEQHKFFKTVYRIEEASPDAFDLIINRDHLKGPFHAAKIVACAFEQKFGLKPPKKIQES